MVRCFGCAAAAGDVLSAIYLGDPHEEAHRSGPAGSHDGVCAHRDDYVHCQRSTELRRPMKKLCWLPRWRPPPPCALRPRCRRSTANRPLRQRQLLPTPRALRSARKPRGGRGTTSPKARTPPSGEERAGSLWASSGGCRDKEGRRTPTCRDNAGGRRLFRVRMVGDAGNAERRLFSCSPRGRRRYQGGAGRVGAGPRQFSL
jgi:hypothetical protein